MGISVTDNGSPARTYVFPNTGGNSQVWAIAVADSGMNSATADLYIQNDKVIYGGTFTVTLTFSDSTQASVNVAEVYNDPNLRTSTLMGTSLNQDGSDNAAKSSTVGSTDRLQDVHLRLTGLLAQSIAQIDILPYGNGYGHYQYVASGAPTLPAALDTVSRARNSSDWRVALSRSGTSSTGDLYIQPNRFENNNQYRVFVTYWDKTFTMLTIGGVTADPNLRTPMVTGTSLGQDGSDYARQYIATGADGLKDLHLRLSGLPTDLVIDQIDVSDSLAPQRRFQFHEPTTVFYPGFDPTLWAIALSHASQAPTAELYVQYDRTVSNGTFQVKVTYSDGTYSLLAITGISNNPGLITGGSAPILSLSETGASMMTSDDTQRALPSTISANSGPDTMPGAELIDLALESGRLAKKRLSSRGTASEFPWKGGLAVSSAVLRSRGRRGIFDESRG